MSAAIQRAAETLGGDTETMGLVASGTVSAVGDTGSAGLAALERRARELLAGNLLSTPDGRRAAAAYLWDIEAWAVRLGHPYIVSFAPRAAAYVEARVARVRGFESVTRDVAYRQLEGDVLRSDLFAEVGRRLPADAPLPVPARALANAPAVAGLAGRFGNNPPVKTSKLG